MLAGSFLVVILDTAVKWLAKGYSPLQIGFVRYVIGLGVAAGIATRAGGLRHASHPAHRAGHLVPLRPQPHHHAEASIMRCGLLPLADSIAI